MGEVDYCVSMIADKVETRFEYILVVFVGSVQFDLEILLDEFFYAFLVIAYCECFRHF